MLVLGIESSCDETAVALVEVTRNPGTKNYSSEILFESVASQIDLHSLYGGVVPELAARQHLASLPILVEQALQVVKEKNFKIDLAAVTQGPGLKGCLLIGLEFAKGFCTARSIPLMGVNHIEGHVHAAKLLYPELTEPFMALVVSGGHTEIVKVKSFGEYQVLARTIDDAAGEAFDKSANLLGFEYPGGASLAKLADTVQSSRFELPKVMRESPGFSFSGLKTAISLLIQRNAEACRDPSQKAELASSIQSSIVDALLFKLKKELEQHTVTAITVTGGVACNKSLRERIRTITNLPVYFPRLEHCVDNAAMIALVGGLRFMQQGISNYPSEVLARWPIESINL